MNDDDPKISRRGLLKASLPVLAAVGLGASTTGCGGAHLPSGLVAAGPLDAIEPGSPQRLEGYDVYLLRNEQGLAAVSGRCTHSGCGVTPVADDGFHCPCHGSDFAADGTVTRGPAQRDLPWFAVSIEDGQVVVDATREVPKGTYAAL